VVPRDAADSTGSSAGRQLDRLTLTQRVQHIVLVVSCVLLVITGLPILFHDGSAGETTVKLIGGASARAALHRIGAGVLMALCAWHVLYILFSRRAHEDFLRVLPRGRDLRDVGQALRAYVGSAAGPRFGHFSTVEKVQYWAVAGGCLMMILTGLAMWFHDQVLLSIPKFWLDVARIMHGRGAVLGFLAIIVWHLYQVHLRPGVFPMSMVWLTGKISEEQMRTDHPLEFEMLAGAPVSDTSQGEAAQPSSSSEGGDVT